MPRVPRWSLFPPSLDMTFDASLLDFFSSTFSTSSSFYGISMNVQICVDKQRGLSNQLSSWSSWRAWIEPRAAMVHAIWSDPSASDGLRPQPSLRLTSSARMPMFVGMVSSMFGLDQLHFCSPDVVFNAADRMFRRLVHLAIHGGRRSWSCNIYSRALSVGPRAPIETR